jgi:hypothetical protein
MTGCQKTSEFFGVEICSIIQPIDTIISCQPVKPIVKVLYSGVRSISTVCTLRARIWRYEIKMDSLGSISMDTTKPISVYDTFDVVTPTPGIHLETLPEWRPVWSDIYRVGQHHTLEVNAHIDFHLMSVNDRFVDDFIVKARSYDLQVNYVGLLHDTLVIRSDTINVGEVYNPVSVVSNSPCGPSAYFRAWYKVIRMNTGVLVYSRYLNHTLSPGQYECLYYQSGYVPSDSGMYKMTSYLETRPGVDSVTDNNSIERLFYAKLITVDAVTNKYTQDELTSKDSGIRLELFKSDQ